MIFFCIYSFHEIVMKIFVILLHLTIQMQKNLELRKKEKILDFLAVGGQWAHWAAPYKGWR